MELSRRIQNLLNFSRFHAACTVCGFSELGEVAARLNFHSKYSTGWKFNYYGAAYQWNIKNLSHSFQMWKCLQFLRNSHRLHAGTCFMVPAIRIKESVYASVCRRAFIVDALEKEKHGLGQRRPPQKPPTSRFWRLSAYERQR